MDDRVDRVLCKDSFNGFKVCEVTILKGDLLPHNGFNSTDCFGGGIVEIVEDHSIVSRLDDLNGLDHINDTTGNERIRCGSQCSLSLQ